MADATHMLKIVIKVVDNGIGNLDRASNSLSKVNSITNAVNDSFIKESKRLNANNEFMKTHIDLFEKMNVKTKKTSTNFDKMNLTVMSLKNNMLGFGLSALFTGMALKRFSESIMKTLMKGFMELTDNTHAGHAAIMGLTASFEFLKFTIFDTLSQSDLFLNIIGFLVSMLDWMSQFVQKHPILSKIIGGFAIMGIIIGAISMTIGQVVLGMLGLIAAGELLKGKGIIVNLQSIYSILGKIALSVGILILAFVLIKTVAESNLNPVIQLLLTVGIVLAAITLIALIFGVSLSLPFILGAIAVGVVIAAFILLSKHLGGLDLAFKAFGIFLLAILAAIADAIYEAFIYPLRIVIGIINMLISANNKLAGTKIGKTAGLGKIDLIEQPEAFTQSKKVWEMRNELIAEGERRKAEKANKDKTDKEAESGTPSSVTVDDYSLDKLADKIGFKTETATKNGFLEALKESGVEIVPTP